MIVFIEMGAVLLALIQLTWAALGAKLCDKPDNWRRWFLKYVPENISEWAILGIYSLLSIKGLPKKVREKHLTENVAAWSRYREENGNGSYIERQDRMTSFPYGRHTGDYNACEVIAVYNALRHLTGGDETDSFPALLEEFERRGITRGGDFGTSPMRLRRYFQKKGYAVDLMVGKKIRTVRQTGTEKKSPPLTFILTTYNDRTNLEAMIHTVCITETSGRYTIHNDYEGTRSYPSLEAAVQGYHGGKGKPICLMGIRRCRT